MSNVWANAILGTGTERGKYPKLRHGHRSTFISKVSERDTSTKTNPPANNFPAKRLVNPPFLLETKHLPEIKGRISLKKANKPNPRPGKAFGGHVIPLRRHRGVPLGGRFGTFSTPHVRGSAAGDFSEPYGTTALYQKRQKRHISEPCPSSSFVSFLAELRLLHPIRTPPPKKPKKMVFRLGVLEGLPGYPETLPKLKPLSAVFGVLCGAISAP